MKNNKSRIALFFTAAMMLLVCSCDKDKNNSDVSVNSGYNNVTTQSPEETTEPDEPEFKRVRDYVYDVSELSSLDLTGYEHIYVQGRLEYEGHGFNENEHMDIDVKANRDSYSFDMKLIGSDGQSIDCAFNTLCDGNVATGAEYQFGDYVNIHDYNDKDIVMYCVYSGYGKKVYDKLAMNEKKVYLRCCQPVLIDEIDEFHKKMEQHKKDLVENKITVDMIEDELYSDPFAAYFNYNSYMVNLEGIVGHSFSSLYLYDSSNKYDGKYEQRIFNCFLDESLYIPHPSDNELFNKKGLIAFSETAGQDFKNHCHKYHFITEDYLIEDEKIDVDKLY